MAPFLTALTATYFLPLPLPCEAAGCEPALAALAAAAATAAAAPAVGTTVAAPAAAPTLAPAAAPPAAPPTTAARTLGCAMTRPETNNANSNPAAVLRLPMAPSRRVNVSLILQAC